MTPQIGLVGLSGGGVLATSDRGRTWTALDTEGPSFRALSYPAAGRAYGLTGDNILWTSGDGGRTWTRVRAFVPSTPAFSLGLDFTGADTGWVAVGASLNTTSDGGAHWSSRPAPCAKGFSAGPMDAAHGYLICAGQPSAGAQEKALYSSADGGATWGRISGAMFRGGPPAGGLPAYGYAGDLVFVSPQVGYLTEERGGLFRTDDGGRTFHRVLEEDSASEMAWLSATAAYLPLPRALLVTDDGGTTWRQLYPALAPAASVAFITPERGFGLGTIADGEAVLTTADGGHTWTAVGRVPGDALQLTIEPPGVLWAFGDGLYRSTDSGRTWVPVSRMPPPGGGALEGLAFPTPTTGFAEDNHGQIFRTDDGGRTWVGLPPASVPGGAGLVFATASLGWAVEGADGVWQTDDGGASWRPVVGWSTPPMRGWFAGPSRGWLVGAGCGALPSCAGVLLRTSDGGAVWDEIAFAATSGGQSFVGATSLDFVTADVGYAELNGYLYRTGDGGVTWSLL